MAGNIVPAIATTNAVIAGLIVMEALKVLAGDFNKCKQVKLPSPFLHFCTFVKTGRVSFVPGLLVVCHVTSTYTRVYCVVCL